MVAIKVIAVILGLVGLVGCFLPVLPGPPISWSALLILYFFGEKEMTLSFLLIWLAVTVVVTILDYLVPAYFTKMTGGSRAASRGSLVGMLLGILFFPPLGMVVGAFLGALLCEMFFEKKNLGNSLKSAFGSFLGFLGGTFIKLASSAVMMFYIIKFI